MSKSYLGAHTILRAPEKQRRAKFAYEAKRFRKHLREQAEAKEIMTEQLITDRQAYETRLAKPWPIIKRPR